MPLIDALMRDLLATGFLPHYGRMITSCYFAVDLKQDWRFGAAHYEEHLLDHDVHANIANWSRVAAIAGRFLPFNSLIQSKRFDSEGEFIKYWVPELADVPAAYIHAPWDMPEELQKKCGVQISEQHTDKSLKHYPTPIKCDKYTSADAFAKRAKEFKTARKPDEENDLTKMCAKAEKKVTKTVTTKKGSKSAKSDN